MVSNTKYKWNRYNLYSDMHFLACLHGCELPVSEWFVPLNGVNWDRWS